MYTGKNAPLHVYHSKHTKCVLKVSCLSFRCQEGLTNAA